MFQASSLILYVKNVDASSKFYEKILGRTALERFKGFSLFKLNGNFTLGLQDRYSIDPAAEPNIGGMEISMSYATRKQVDELYHAYKSDNIKIAMEPTELEFGYTFVALDPDGHRLRVCATEINESLKA